MDDEFFLIAGFSWAKLENLDRWPQLGEASKLRSIFLLGEASKFRLTVFARLS